MARKKNAPAIKSNLRDVPADKFRAVNRMNGIVTMVEYSSEDDIKAYELEPTFRELGGGGEGGSSITPILKLTLTEDSQSFTVPRCSIVDGHVLDGELTITAGHTQDILILDEGSLFGFMLSASHSSDYQVTNMVNCTLFEEDGEIGLIITDPSQNASATLKKTDGLG